MKTLRRRRLTAAIHGLLALMLCAAPLRAQRVVPIPLRHGAARGDSHASASWFPHEDEGGWSGMQPWERHAIIGGAIGGIGGWMLSGLPCENAPSNCPSTATSVVAGAAIGALVGALWSWGRQF